MSFAKAGEAALGLMESARFDVIASDMHMPGMDGAELLKMVRDKYPQVVRMIFASQAELEATVRAVPAAHQFLLKPCDPGTMRVAIGRATGLFDVLNDSVLTRIAGPITDLPSLPRTYAALQSALSDPDVSLDKVARIVEQDVAISAKTLQLVNSALFGVRREIATVRTAVSYLGIKLLQDVILSAEVFQAFKGLKPIQGFSLEELFSHCQLTAKIAGGLHASELMPEAPVVAGLLHDVGKLVLATRMPKGLAQALAVANDEHRPLYAVETVMLGVLPAEVGGYLLGLWGLPSPVVEAVTHHHRPDRVPHQKLDAITAVHIANALAHKYAPPQSGVASSNDLLVDMECLTQLGVVDQLPAWEEMAESTTSAFFKTANS